MDGIRFYWARAYTKLEFAAVIALLAAMLALLLPRYLDLLNEARKAEVVAQGSSLKSAVLAVHERWYLNGQPETVAPLSVFGRQDILVSASGWPLDVASASGNVSGQNTGLAPENTIAATARCMRLWQALLQDTAPALYTGYEFAVTDSYRVHWISGVCRYTQVTADNHGKTVGQDIGGHDQGKAFYIEYNAANGRVTWFIR